MQRIRVRISGQLCHEGYAPEEEVLTPRERIRAGELIEVHRHSLHGFVHPRHRGRWDARAARYRVAGLTQGEHGEEILLLDLDDGFPGQSWSTQGRRLLPAGPGRPEASDVLDVRRFCIPRGLCA